MEFHQTVTVQEGGKVTLNLTPNLVGEVIEVTIRLKAPLPRGARKAGSLSGRIHLGPQFDEPLPDMEAYE